MIMGESVARYVGYSAASIAGACCYKLGFLPWVRYPGLVVCLSDLANDLQNYVKKIW